MTSPFQDHFMKNIDSTAKENKNVQQKENIDKSKTRQ